MGIHSFLKWSGEYVEQVLCEEFSITPVYRIDNNKQTMNDQCTCLESAVDNGNTLFLLCEQNTGIRHEVRRKFLREAISALLDLVLGMENNGPLAVFNSTNKYV